MQRKEVEVHDIRGGMGAQKFVAGSWYTCQQLTHSLNISDFIRSPRHAKMRIHQGKDSFRIVELERFPSTQAEDQLRTDWMSVGDRSMRNRSKSLN